MRRPAILVLGSGWALAAVLGGLAVADIPDSQTGQIVTCYEEDAETGPSGEPPDIPGTPLRVIDTDVRSGCPLGYAELRLNQRGVPGPKGDRGLTGSRGATGPRGSQGPPGSPIPTLAKADSVGIPQGQGRYVVSLRLPAGAYSVQGTALQARVGLLHDSIRDLGCDLVYTRFARKYYVVGGRAEDRRLLPGEEPFARTLPLAGVVSVARDGGSMGIYCTSSIQGTVRGSLVVTPVRILPNTVPVFGS